jgi:hypothetical protein
VPFLIALGFALAAITAMLIQHFGHVAGYWLMAGSMRDDAHVFELEAKLL